MGHLKLAGHSMAHALKNQAKDMPAVPQARSHAGA